MIQEESDFYPFGSERIVTDTLTDQNYKFTSQERDPETNLDYFGERYYSSVFGRFVSTDKLFLTAARLLDPQTQNLYAYVRNSPLTHIDPDGNDAIAIGFPNYRPTLGDLGRPLALGHAAMVTVDKQGNTRYYQYGRYQSNQGETQRRPVPDLVMGKDGKPTEASLQKLLKYISEHYGQGGEISAVYIQTTDEQTARMNAYADRMIQRNNDPSRPTYSPAGGPTCSTFVQDVLNAGGVSFGGLDVVPRTMILNVRLANLFNKDARALSFNPKAPNMSGAEARRQERERALRNGWQ